MPLKVMQCWQIKCKRQRNAKRDKANKEIKMAKQNKRQAKIEHPAAGCTGRRKHTKDVSRSRSPTAPATRNFPLPLPQSAS